MRSGTAGVTGHITAWRRGALRSRRVSPRSSTTIARGPPRDQQPGLPHGAGSGKPLILAAFFRQILGGYVDGNAHH
jgi:hypothetical protein